MSLQNLSEDKLYNLLPEGIISLDEQGLISAVVGGYNDRVDDLRAYMSKFELLVTGQGLPESDAVGAAPNAVIARIQSPKGKVYNRSLEIKDDTPASGSADLITWVAAQLQLDEEHVLLSAAYGVDMLRLVDANVLPYLAATVGAVLYRSAALDPVNENSDSRRLLQTWFPRLQFKGTAESFETLGRLLGFDDVRMTPLWQRLSPRVPNDVGDPANDPDFSEVPDFYPKQVRDNFYDPWNLTDGPYYAWSGTATARFGTNSTEFYTQVINGFNPFFKVGIIGTNPIDLDPALSPYILTGGGPETKAFVNPSGTGMKFEAVAAGSSFNGLAVHVQSWNQGTHRLISVNEQLSAIKYRSSYFDLSLAIDFDRAETRFGVSVADPNKDLQASGTSANFGSQASSPYRPWKNGSFAQATVLHDWLTETDPLASQTAVSYRTQADLGDRQLNHAEVTAAGLQVIQAMEEVRPATRQPRNVNMGYLMRDQVGYADYCSFGTVFAAVAGIATYSGTLSGYPYPPYAVTFSVQSGDAVSALTQERDPYNSDYMRIGSADLSVTGTYDHSNSSWMFNFPAGVGAGSDIKVYAHYQPTSTEIVREQPAIWSDPTYIGVTSDSIYSPEQAAANNLVRGWNVDAFFHCGDASQVYGWPGHVFRDFINAQDFINAGKFFRCPGNHDFYNPDSPVYFEPVSSGDIKGWGQTYRVWPLTGGDTVTYNGVIYHNGDTFTGINGVTTFTTTGGAWVRRRAEFNNNWDLSIENNYLDYLPGNGRYYHVRIGHVELFVVNDGYNNAGDPGFTGNNRKPPEPDGNWCEAPFSPIGAGAKAPASANPILVEAGVTYTVHTEISYGEKGDRLRPNYVVYQGGTYTNLMTFVADLAGPTYALAYGEPCLDPAPVWVVLRQARKYRVIANPGSNYVDYQGKRYYGGDVIQADMVLDHTAAIVTGRVRIDRMNSIQAALIKDWLKRSQAPWKIVMYHHPDWESDAWNSGHGAGQYPRTDWPWKGWGADLTMSGHVHAYARSLSGGLTRIIIGLDGPPGPAVFSTAGTDYHDPDAIVEYATSATYPVTATTDSGAMLLVATPTRLQAHVETIYGATIDDWSLTKPECVRGYQERPEDELDEPMMDLADEYPWRRDLVNGGELIDRATYNPPTPDVTVTQVGQSIAVFSQTGAQYDVSLAAHGPHPPNFQVEVRSLTPYEPGQMAIGYTGTFCDLATLNPRQREELPRRTLSQETLDGVWVEDLGVDHCVDDMDWAFNPGWRLYHFGLVQGVLVADPVKFFGKHHRDNLVAWFPFNEHPYNSTVTADHSVIGDSLLHRNVVPLSREYDPWRGWHLHANVGLSLGSTDRTRNLAGPVTVSFWIMRPEGSAPGTEILGIGSIKLLMGSAISVDGTDNTGALHPILAGAVLNPGWTFCAFTYDPADGTGYWKFYQGRMDTPAVLVDSQTWNGQTWSDTAPISVTGCAGGFYVHDLRVWNSAKTMEELELVRYHNPTPTACLYRPAFLTSVNDYDRYGVRVLDSGYISPDLLPSSIKTPSEAWVSRYDATGQYQAQSRFKETGIGSGVNLPAKQFLGLQWDTLTAAGTVVVSTWGSGYGGVNTAWLFDCPTPLALQLLQSGSTIYGIPPTYIDTGILRPWPNPLQATNACRDRIWVRGDDSYVYEVKVIRSGINAFGLAAERIFTLRTDAELVLAGTEGTYSPLLQVVASAGLGGTHCVGVTSYGTVFPGQLVVVYGTDTTTDDGAWAITSSGAILGGSVLPSAGTYDVQLRTPGSAKILHPAKLRYADQPTGAEVALTNCGYHTQLRVNAAGQVYAAAYSGTLYSPWIYMYGNEEVVVNESGAVAYGHWANESGFGLSQGVAALADNGQITFELDQTALPGNYRLEVISGNIGQVDENFDGFKVVVTVGDFPFEARLCQGKIGANFSQIDTFDFTLPHVLPGRTLGYNNTWLLDFNWYNALRDAARGTARQLAISGFRLIRLNTTLYELKLIATGSQLTEVSTGSNDFPATPGGWMAALTSWGTAYGYTHESKIYSANDTYTSRYPISNVLTATTGERRQDLLMGAPAMISDPPPPVLPTYGPIVIT